MTTKGKQKGNQKKVASAEMYSLGKKQIMGAAEGGCCGPGGVQERGSQGKTQAECYPNTIGLENKRGWIL